MNLYPLVKIRQVRRFYNHNRGYILAVLFVVGFVAGFVVGSSYQYRKTQEAIETRLSNCINPATWEYKATDYCLYGQGGYQTR